MIQPVTPQMPFVWPEPLVSSGGGRYATALPFEVVARTALSVFGVVSAIDARAVNWMEGLCLSHAGRSSSRAQVFHSQAVALHGLDDLRDGGLLLGLGVSLGRGKEGAGLLQQILESSVGQRLLPGGV